MSQADWAKLRDWLVTTFGAQEGAELFAAHVEEARAAGLELPAV